MRAPPCTPREERVHPREGEGRGLGVSTYEDSLRSYARHNAILCADSRHAELTEYREKDVVTRLFSKFTRVARRFPECAFCRMCGKCGTRKRVGRDLTSLNLFLNHFFPVVPRNCSPFNTGGFMVPRKIFSFFILFL